MNISSKLKLLNLIVILTICINVFVSYELAEGAHLHELNFNHLKYNEMFHDHVLKYKEDKFTDLSILEEDIHLIKRQPEQCLASIQGFDKLFMKMIGTYDAVMLCKKDVGDAVEILNFIQAYKDEQIKKAHLLVLLEGAVINFRDNSEKFDPLVKKTVDSLFKTLIVLGFIAGISVILLVYFISAAVSDDFKRLKNTQKQLASANSELEEFAYRASHDLRSPLISVIGLLGVIKSSVTNDDKKTSLTSIDYAESTLGKLENLIQDILALTEIENFDEPPQSFSLKDLIDSSIESTQNLDGAENIKLDTNITVAEDVYVQKLRLATILENLISNAIKYHDPQKTDPYVKITAEHQTDKSIIINIEDNGLGIPQDMHNKIFTMFSRFHPKTSFGSGLGLYLVKKSVDALNGEVQYVDLGQGSVFIIKIPQAEEKQP